MKKQPIAVYGYARVSTGKQEHSIPAQITKITAQAVVKGLDVIEIIPDSDASAKSLNRPGMNRLMELIERGQVSTIIIAKLDRLTRSIIDFAVLLKLLEKKNVELISVAESFDTSTATGRMTVKLIVLISEWEREIIGERTRDAMAGMKSRGLRTGNIPYGFQCGAQVGTTKDGKPVHSVVPNANEQSTLDLIARARTKNYSYALIAGRLNELKIKTRRGGAWRAEYVWSIHKSRVVETVEAIAATAILGQNNQPSISKP